MTQVEQVGHKAKEVLNFRAGGGATAPSTDTLARLLNLWFVVSGKTTVPGVAGVMPEQRLTRGRGTEFATEKLRLVHQSRWEGGYAGDG
jgi:hypothetical protein